MVTPAETHEVSVAAPWYAPSGSNVAIHRYFETGFIAQFQADVANAPENNANLFAWQQTDTLSTAPGVLKLRRPVHRTFHVVAWEASCQMTATVYGQPAIAPEKIAAAGFVLRYDDQNQGAMGFQLLQGKPQGWAPVETSGDPDTARFIKLLGLVPRTAVAAPGYTGEETFPLHPLAVTDGNTPHTLLYGYLPIGGGTYVPSTAAPPDPNGPPHELPWPFGFQARRNGAPRVYTFDAQITSGSIDPGLAAVLRVLLGRYQLVDPTAWISPDANLANIIAILNSLNFYYAPATPRTGAALREWASDNATGQTLGQLLRAYAGPVPASTDVGTPNPAPSMPQPMSQAAALLKSLSQGDPSQPVALPTSDPTTSNLLIVESDAQKLRVALQAQLAQAIATLSTTMPIPKLVSGPNGRYYVVPFVRTVKPDGCERINWGSPCAPFAVASAFDPDASRPTLIEMPQLSDAKRGLAVGASFDMPPDLANLVNGVAGAATSSNIASAPPAGGLGIRFICSFSLPAISICAMLMLSITLSLLNIFLGWMAWVKICIPYPVKK